jgi:Rrf2 family transcriptional regulator, cysteine metabolism repressor
MKLSAKTEYACIAMVQLAKEYGNGDPLLIRRISDEHGISANFLVQILLQLNRASLVASRRGTLGGYRLARRPSKITLAEVIEAMEGHKRPAIHAGKKTLLARSLLRLCRELDSMKRDRLGEITLAHLVEQAGDGMQIIRNIESSGNSLTDDIGQ